MLQMIWEWVPSSDDRGATNDESAGTAYARKPRSRDGQPRIPDGVKWLSLEQVMKKTGRSREFYLQDYRSSMADLLGEEDAAAILVDESVPPADPGKTTTDAAPTAKLSAGDAATHVPPAQLARLDLLRVMRYPEFDDSQWEFFLAQCQTRRLNPLCNQIYGRLEMDADTRKMKVMVIVSIDGFRLISDRTGRDAGMETPRWTLDASGRVLSAEATVRKLVGDPQIVQTVSAVAHADEYTGMGLAEYEERMPKHRLAKIAEAQARRAAFPQELGGLHAPEEFAERPAGPKRFEPSVDRRPGVREAIDEPWQDEVPEIPSHGQGGRRDLLMEAHRRLVAAGR